HRNKLQHLQSLLRRRRRKLHLKQLRPTGRNHRNQEFAALKPPHMPLPLSHRLLLAKNKKKKARKRKKTNGFGFAACPRLLPPTWTRRCPCQPPPPYAMCQSRPWWITVRSSITTCNEPAVVACPSPTSSDTQSSVRWSNTQR